MNSKYDLINDESFDIIDFYISNYNRCMVKIKNKFNIDISPSFAEQFGIQLTKKAEEILNMKNIYKNETYFKIFSDYFPDNNPIIQSNGSCYIRSEIYYSMFGISIFIKWKSLKDEVEYINPSDNVDENTIEFDICMEEKEIPKKLNGHICNIWKESYLSHYEHDKPELLSKEITGYKFDVDIKLLTPSLNFKIFYSDNISNNELIDFSLFIDEYVAKWNENKEQKPDYNYINYYEIIKNNNIIDVYINLRISVNNFVNEFTDAINKRNFSVKSIMVLRKKENRLDYYKKLLKHGLEKYDPINYNIFGINSKSNVICPKRCMVLLENAKNIDIHPAFAEQFGIQISYQVEKILNINNIYKYDSILKLFTGHEIYERNPVFNLNGYSYTVGEIKLDVFSGNLYFKWRSIVPEVEYFKFHDFVDENMIEFKICLDNNDFPIEYANNDLSSWVDFMNESFNFHTPKKSLSRKNKYSFAVETHTPMFPDVNYEIYFKGKVDKKRIESLSRAVSDYIENYNAESEKKKKERFIHYFDIPEEAITERTIELYVDFGSASTRALKGLLAALDQTDLDIDMVSID